MIFCYVVKSLCISPGCLAIFRRAVMKVWQRRHFWGVGLLLAGLVPWICDWHWILKIPSTGALALAIYLFWDLLPRKRSD